MNVKKLFGAVLAAISIMLAGNAFAAKDGLPNGQPFQILESNVTVLAEMLDELSGLVGDLEITIADLEARIAILEGAEDDDTIDNAKACKAAGGVWVQRADGSFVCKIKKKVPPKAVEEEKKV